MPANILLLQGPVGPFFHHLADELEAQGHTVLKINLNGGDRFFFHDARAVDYGGHTEGWPGFLEAFLSSHDIQRICVFGDCRYYHRVAREKAEQAGIRMFCFEEGYFRPDYITLEEGGVNGYSRLPKDPLFYRQWPPLNLPDPDTVGGSFGRAAIYAMIYYIASALSGRFPYYRHHRPLMPWAEGSRWVLTGVRKLLYRLTEMGLRGQVRQLSGRYFLVPLQVHTDAQILHHSPYGLVERFVMETITSFARHAHRDAFLVFKGHPMDRGYRNYRALIEGTARAKGISKRVLLLHDDHLPTLIKGALGVVTVNSTSGLSALHHGTPVKVMGVAIYDIEGLTDPRPLTDFWANPAPVDGDLYRRFRNYVLNSTQFNGNFYRRLRASGNRRSIIPLMRTMATHEESKHDLKKRKQPNETKAV